MSMRTMPQMLAAFGAPPTLVRRSWGATRFDKSVVLSVWQDRSTILKEHGDRRFMQLTHLEKYGGDSTNYGYTERQRHVELIRKGWKCYMIVCIAEDVKAESRTIRRALQDFIFVGGELVQHDGEWYIEMLDKIPTSALLI